MQIFRVSLKIYHIKEKFVFVSRRWFSFGLFNFVESFSLMWTALLKMLFAITVMVHFSIGAIFNTVVRIFAKLAFFNYVISLSGGLNSRFWMFWNLVQINGLVWLKNFSGMFTSLFGSMTCKPANTALGRDKSDSQRRLSLQELSFVQQTIISFAKGSWRASNSHSELHIFQFCDKVMEVLPLMLLIRKKLTTKYNDVLSRGAVFRELL